MIDPMVTYKNDSLINTFTCYQYSAYFLFEINNILKMTIVFTLKKFGVVLTYVVTKGNK